MAASATRVMQDVLTQDLPSNAQILPMSARQPHRHARDAYAEGLALASQSRHAEAIGCYERALRETPDDSRVLFALGNTASALGMPLAAEEFFRRVLQAEPGRLEALVNLANLLRGEGRFDAAEALLAPALARDGSAAELWLTLGSVYRETGDANRAAAFYREALARRPDYPAALGNLADILADEGQIDEALALYARVLTREPKNAQARLNRAILNLLRGDLKAGWSDYAARLDLVDKAPHCDHGLARWTGSCLKNKRLLVTAEQGVGDQMMFASLIPDLCARARDEGGRIVFECESRLTALFERSFPEADVRASRMDGATDAISLTMTGSRLRAAPMPPSNWAAPPPAAIPTGPISAAASLSRARSSRDGAGGRISAAPAP